MSSKKPFYFQASEITDKNYPHSKARHTQERSNNAQKSCEKKIDKAPSQMMALIFK
jgi:hypothetical protein